MTTWTSISNASVGVGGIPSSTTMTALRDNSAAMAEAATGAPAIFAGWHPVDKLTVGDSKTGLIYDFASNGTVAEVVTPAFQDGYEYKIVAHGLQHNSGDSRRLTIEGQFSGSYRQLVQTTAATGSFGIVAEFHMPRISSRWHIVDCVGYYGTNTFVHMDQSSTAYLGTTPSKMDRAKVIFTVGSIVAGQIWLFRRREYASLA